MQLTGNFIHKYTCLVVDPPWDQGKTGKRSVRPNQTTELDYPTMSVEEIMDIPLHEWVTENAYLWLWATNSRSRSTGKPIITHAFDLMEHWGFRYYTMITWDKRNALVHLDHIKLQVNIVYLVIVARLIFQKKVWEK